jgi:hypothetical protein
MEGEDFQSCFKFITQNFMIFPTTQILKPFLCRYSIVTKSFLDISTFPTIMTTAGPLSDYDAIERNVGIQVYLSDDPGFAGVVKARYSDFIVHEGKKNLVAPKTKPKIDNISSVKLGFLTIYFRNTFPLTHFFLLFSQPYGSDGSSRITNTIDGCTES